MNDTSLIPLVRDNVSDDETESASKDAHPPEPEQNTRAVEDGKNPEPEKPPDQPVPPDPRYVIPDSFDPEADPHEKKEEPEEEDPDSNSTQESNHPVAKIPEEPRSGGPLAALKSRIKEKPALLVPIGGILLAAWMVSRDACEEPVTNQDAKARQIGYQKAGIPAVEAPEGMEKTPTVEEVQRVMIQASQKRNRSGVTKVPDFTPNKKDASSDPNHPKTRLAKLRNRRRKRGRGAERAEAANRNQQPSEEETSPALNSVRPRSAAFYQAGATIQTEGGGKEGKQSIGLAAGTQFTAELQVGVSTAFSSATVLAKITDEVRVAGKVVLPAGVTLQGRMRSSDDRIFLDLHTVVLPKGKRLSIKGYAVSGKLPGIKARVRQTEDSAGSSVMGRGALRTASGVVGGLGGGNLGAQLARNVATEGLTDMRRSTTNRPHKVLELPAGTSFQVVVTE